MPSPFNAAERCKILQVAGIPPGTQTLNVSCLVAYPYSNVEQWKTSFYSKGDLSAIVTAIDEILNKYTDAATGDATRECFDDWDVVKFSEVEITNAAGTSGPALFNAKLKRREIRRYMANLLGFFIPEDGYLHEMQAVMGASVSEFRKNLGGR